MMQLVQTEILLRPPHLIRLGRLGLWHRSWPPFTHRGAAAVGEKFVTDDDDARGGGDVDELAAYRRLTVTRASALGDLVVNTFSVLWHVTSILN
jgi:hypothetical protein